MRGIHCLNDHYKHWRALLAALATLLLACAAPAQTCPFDDGNSSLEVEGLILTRYALGITGAPLVANTGISAVDAPTVEASINCPSCGLHITGNASLTVADATIISRKLAGFQGASLTAGLALGSGSRNTPALVQSFLLSGCGATGGTVTSITAGTGLTGGTITAAGTLAADTSYLQRRLSSVCTAGSFISAVAADGSVTCGAPAASGGGTVTSVGTGAGLVGGPITAAGTIGLTNNQLLPTTACTTNQIAKWNGSAWACAADNDVNNTANDARYFRQGGNAFGAPAVLGTTDGQALTVGIGGGSGLRIVAGSLGDSPNVLNASSSNATAATGYAMTVAGGGAPGNSCPNLDGSAGRSCANVVTSDGGTVGGGTANQSGSQAVVAGGLSNSGSGIFATVAGGTRNSASGFASSVGGGRVNTASGDRSTVVGGELNTASGFASAVDGGQQNTASASYSRVGGGYNNFATAPGALVSGGANNVAAGVDSSIPGGFLGSTALHGQVAHAAGSFSGAAGTAQASEYVLRAATSDATSTSLFLDGASVTLLFEAGRAALVDIQVIALQNNVAGNLAAWSFRCIYQVNPAGTGFLFPTGCGKTAVQKDPSASTWEATVAKGASQELLITATGEAAKNIRWVATVRATEVKW